jgi:TDG/mug DNA glycosylase family protein
MVLNDLIAPGLKLVICGTAVGRATAAKRAYYSGAGNRFWMVLHEVGLTPNGQLAPVDFPQLLDFRIGLTDLVKCTAGNDSELEIAHFDVEGLRQKICEARPAVLAFNGKKAGSIFLNRPTRALQYGKQADCIGETAIWILPSTSGAARGHWSKVPWIALATELGTDRRTSRPKVAFPDISLPGSSPGATL